MKATPQPKFTTYFICSRYGKTGYKKRATSFAILLQKELNSDVERFTTHVRTFLARFVSWVVKRATSLFNSFCGNVAKQVARLLLPVLLLIYGFTFNIILRSLLLRTTFMKFIEITLQK